MDQYHIYLLHIWTERPSEEGRRLVVRGAVEEPHTGRRWAFSDVESLTKCVEYILADVAIEEAGGSAE